LPNNYLDTKEIRNAIQRIQSLLSTPRSLGDPTFKSLKVKIGRYPTQKDLEPIDMFLNIFKVKKIKCGGRIIEYRYFFKQQISLHIIISKKSHGFTITSHLDIGIHEESQNTLLSSTFLTGLSLVLINAYPQLKRSKSLNKDSLTLIDDIYRKKTVKNGIIKVFNANLDSIILKLVKSSLVPSISESDLLKTNLLKEITPIIGQYLDINDSYVSRLLPEIIGTHSKEIIEKITIIRKNIRIRNEELKNKTIEVESFEWSKSNGTIPNAVKNFIRKRARFGVKTQTVRGRMVPKALYKKGIVELIFRITEDDILVSGYTSKNQQTLKMKKNTFKCSYCSQSFGSKGQRAEHMKKVHKSEAKRTAMLSIARMYLQTSSSDYTKIDKIRNNLKVYMNVYRPCNGCSTIIELRDYYKEHYNPDSIKALIERWNTKKSWVLCPKCEKEKSKIKKFLT